VHIHERQVRSERERERERKRVKERIIPFENEKDRGNLRQTTLSLHSEKIIAQKHSQQENARAQNTHRQNSYILIHFFYKMYFITPFEGNLKNDLSSIIQRDISHQSFFRDICRNICEFPKLEIQTKNKIIFLYKNIYFNSSSF